MAFMLHQRILDVARVMAVRERLLQYLEEVQCDGRHESVSIAYLRRLRGASPQLKATLAWDRMLWYHTIMDRRRRRGVPDLTTLVSHRDVRPRLLESLEELRNYYRHESVTIVYLRQIRLCSKAMKIAMNFDFVRYRRTVLHNRGHVLVLQDIVQRLSDQLLRSEPALVPMTTWFLRFRLVEEFERQYHAHLLRRERREEEREEDAESDSSTN